MLIAADLVIESCGAGSKGERRYTWAWVATASRHHHLLIRRSLIPNAKGVRELAFYLCSWHQALRLSNGTITHAKDEGD